MPASPRLGLSRQIFQLNKITAGLSTPPATARSEANGSGSMPGSMSGHKQKLARALLEASSLEDISARIQGGSLTSRSSAQTPGQHVPGSVFSLTEAQVSPHESPRLQRTDSFEQLRVDRLLASAGHFQDKMMKTLSALRPSTPSAIRPGTPSSVFARAGRTASFMSAMSTSSQRSGSGIDPEIMNGQLTQNAFVHLQEKWTTNLKRLRQDIEKMRYEMDHSENMQKEIERLKRENEELKRNREEVLSQMEQQTEQLYSNASWWMDLFVTDGDITRRAANLAMKVEEQQKEMLELRAQLRQRTRLCNEIAMAKEHAELVLVQRQQRLGKVASELYKLAQKSLQLASGLRNDLSCLHCGEIMTNPQHLDPCGHAYCLKCVGRHHSSNHVMCRKCQDDEVQMSTQQVLVRMTARARRRDTLAKEIEELLPYVKQTAMDASSTELRLDDGM